MDILNSTVFGLSDSVVKFREWAISPDCQGSWCNGDLTSSRDGNRKGVEPENVHSGIIVVYWLGRHPATDDKGRGAGEGHEQNQR